MRLEYQRVLPEANRAMGELEKVVESATLEPKLLELVKQRASQINGCAYCLDISVAPAAAHLRGRSRLSWCGRVTRRRDNGGGP